MRLWSLHCQDCKCKRTVPTLKGADKKFATIRYNWTKDRQLI